MRPWRKVFAVTVLTPILAVVGYVIYLWATYLDETLVSGTAHGFTIGESKTKTLESAVNLRDHPRAVVYVSYGPRAGDNFTVEPSPAQIEQLQGHEQWDVLLDGADKFSNSVRLTFRDGKLAEIYRHRQYFEFP